MDGTRFTLDGEPAFLLGVSYYGGLARTPELMASDLDALRDSRWFKELLERLGRG